MSKKPTAQQKLFVHEYLIDLNATQAAIRAGYGETSASSMGSQLMSTPHIKDKIQELMDQRAAKVDLSAEKVLSEIMKIAFVDIGDAYDSNGKLKPFDQMSDDVRKTIAGVKVYEEFEGFGKERVQIGEVREVKFWDKPKGLEMLGRHLKLFTDKIELSGTENLAQRLAKARKSRNG